MGGRGNADIIADAILLLVVVVVVVKEEREAETVLQSIFDFRYSIFDILTMEENKLASGKWILRACVRTNQVSKYLFVYSVAVGIR